MRRRREASAATLACQTASRLLQQAPAVEKQKVQALIYCHEAPDARIPESTAGRLQHELGLAQARAFSVSQCHNTSAYAALDLALALLHGPEQIKLALVVASDKLVFPSMKPSTDSLRFGDTAAAMVLTRDPSPGSSLQLVHARLAHCDGMPNAFESWNQAAKAGIAVRCADFIEASLRECGLAADRLAGVLNCGTDETLAARVHSTLGIHASAILNRPTGRSRGTSAADPIMAIEWLQAKGAAAGPALLWGAGNNGELGCCVLIPS
ncbi:hypothetical protein ASF44_30375 [Pseudorhodoferax sp. Leaf274]|nr:hypothetical protein ASF44_30375 [Pseudorhodoferax sp. Leaf274]